MDLPVPSLLFPFSSLPWWRPFCFALFPERRSLLFPCPLHLLFFRLGPPGTVFPTRCDNSFGSRELTSRFYRRPRRVSSTFVSLWISLLVEILFSFPRESFSRTLTPVEKFVRAQLCRTRSRRVMVFRRYPIRPHFVLISERPYSDLFFSCSFFGQSVQNFAVLSMAVSRILPFLPAWRPFFRRLHLQGGVGRVRSNPRGLAPPVVRLYVFLSGLSSGLLTVVYLGSIARPPAERQTLTPCFLAFAPFPGEDRYNLTSLVVP